MCYVGASLITVETVTQLSFGKLFVRKLSTKLFGSSKIHRTKAIESSHVQVRTPLLLYYNSHRKPSRRLLFAFEYRRIIRNFKIVN